jgi:RNA polymerase sigma-70 factor, ECF subfamily
VLLAPFSFHSGNAVINSPLPQSLTADILAPLVTEGPLEFCVFDQGYIDRLRSGDPATEQHFVSYFGQLLGIMLRARRLPPERVDDVRQETFSRVLTIVRRDGVRQADRFGALVNSICKNVLRENSRESYKNQPLEDGHLETADKVIDLEHAYISTQTKGQVRSVLDQLAPRDRDLLRSVFLEESDKDDVCQRLGVDRNYLRVLVHRAKEQFRTLYAQGPTGIAPGAVQKTRSETIL